MKDIFSFIKSKYKSIFNGLLFLVALLILVNLLPREGKFKYEFQKGKPWMHETLIAPYDFPIYKGQKQIRAERDSILNDFKPYYRYDTTVQKNQIKQFTQSYNKRLREAFQQKYNGKTLKDNYINSAFEKHTQNFFQYVLDLFREVYNRGIIELSEDYRDMTAKSEIVVLKDNLAEEYTYGQMYDQKEAYKYVINHVAYYLDSLDLKSNKQADFFDDLNFYDFIKPNVLYDAETTENVKQSMLDNISLTKGMVQAGERIVSR